MITGFDRIFASINLNYFNLFSLRNCGYKERSMAGLQGNNQTVWSSQETRHSSSAAPPEIKFPVLLVGNFLSSTLGIRSVCEDLAIQLAAYCWPVLTTSERRGRLPRLLDMVNTAWYRRYDYTVAQVDVFSGPAFVWAEAVCQILRWVGKPYILTLHGGNLPAFAQKWSRRVRRLLCSATAVTTPSLYLLENMAPYCPHIRLLPNPLDLSAYKFTLRKQLQPSLVWLRSFHTTYNPSLAPRALARLVESFPSISLSMIGPDRGDGSLQAMQQIATELGVTHRIILPGKIPKAEVADWMSRGDIFLNTTNVDNTPVSVLEAMACGLCVVSTNVGGIPYLLGHEHDALLVPPNDPAAIATAVRRLLTEPGLAERLSRNARQKAEQFDWSVILPQWEALLTSVRTRNTHE
jgi:glycosyltransferase involved in cell wall biosynthesis